MCFNYRITNEVVQAEMRTQGVRCVQGMNHSQLSMDFSLDTTLH